MTDHPTTPVPGDASDTAELRDLNRLLLKALLAKSELPVIPVPVPQDGAGPEPAALLGILLGLWHQARAEADAYRAWIRQPAPPPITDVAVHDASETARAHLGSRTGDIRRLCE